MYEVCRIKITPPLHTTTTQLTTDYRSNVMYQLPIELKLAKVLYTDLPSSLSLLAFSAGESTTSGLISRIFFTQPAALTCIKSISQFVDILVTATTHIAANWRTFCGMYSAQSIYPNPHSMSQNHSSQFISYSLPHFPKCAAPHTTQPENDYIPEK